MPKSVCTIFRAGLAGLLRAVAITAGIAALLVILPVAAVVAALLAVTFFAYAYAVCLRPRRYTPVTPDRKEKPCPDASNSTLAS